MPLVNFYETEYYANMHLTKTNSEDTRLHNGGIEADKEIKWLESTLFLDIADMLIENKSHTVLDIGCGKGHLLAYLNSNGFATHGLEPSIDACNFAHTLGVEVTNAGLDDFVGFMHPSDVKYDAIIMRNVLEHIEMPGMFLELARSLLKDNGTLIISVPNDNSLMQQAAVKGLGLPKWWEVPEHLNYFSRETLCQLLITASLLPIDSQSDYPMEMFLLQGVDYITTPDLGAICHQKRVRFELNMPTVERRKLYKAYAKQGIGRSILVVAKKRG